MTFLNATLIFGVATVAIPIALHLLARREPRKVVFPSVRFLVQRFESNRSRLRVRRWWLLALRIAALALLALALARPAIHHSLSVTWLTIGMIAGFGLVLLVMATFALARGTTRSLVYGLAASAVAALLAAGSWATITYATGPAPSIDSMEPVAIAIVLDNSPTSAWQTADDDRLARMKDVATWMVTRLPRTSRIAVMDRSSQVAGFSLDASSAVGKIDQLQPLEVTQSIASRLEAAAQLVRTSDLTNRQILLITDLAISTWEKAGEAGVAAFLQEDPAVSLTVFDLGPFQGRNRALSIPQLSDATPPKDSPVPVTVSVSLAAAETGDSVSMTAELEMFENDPSLPVIRNGTVVRPNAQAVDRATARVAAGGSSQLLLTIPTLSVGTHHGRIRLVGSDAMPLDDARYFSLQVLPPAEVLLVGDDQDEARVIAQAITAGAIDPLSAEFTVERIGYSDLSVVRLADFDVVVMLDPLPSALNDESVARFLAQGGGVLICLGPQAGSSALESSYAPKLVRRWRVPEPGSFFQVVGSKHPVTEPVSSNTPWSSFRIHQYWQLQPLANDQVLMQLAGTEHPALIERTYSPDSSEEGERGRLLVLSTPLPALSKETRSWNDLFGSDPWPAWLLCRQSIEYLARRGENQLMPLVGQSQTIAWGDDVVVEAGQRLQLFPPGEGTPVPLELPENARRLTIRDVSRSGTYWLRGFQSGAGFSANLPEDAIRLKRIDEGELDLIFGADQYSLTHNLEEIEFAENRASQRVSLHSPAILLALAVFLIEQLLGNRFYRGRKPATAIAA